jgi:hypothetical protein|tara:strand:+ start:870 stop:1109 length:240 start_codon:yes stop_codon:yes gene_type:complete
VGKSENGLRQGGLAHFNTSGAGTPPAKSTTDGSEEMSEEDKTIVRRFLTETQNDKNLTIIDDLVADDFVGHTAEVKGPE